MLIAEPQLFYAIIILYLNSEHLLYLVITVSHYKVKHALLFLTHRAQSYKILELFMFILEQYSPNLLLVLGDS